MYWVSLSRGHSLLWFLWITFSFPESWAQVPRCPFILLEIMVWGVPMGNLCKICWKNYWWFLRGIHCPFQELHWANLYIVSLVLIELCKVNAVPRDRWKTFRDSFILCAYILLARMSMHHLWTLTTEARRGHLIPQTRGRDGWEPLCGC